MSENNTGTSSQHDNDSDSSNGSDSEPERPRDDNGNHVEAPACPAGARCHETIERLGRQKLTIQRGKGQTIQNLRQALHRKEMACELKDA
jgi:hypothetical protein